MGHPERTCHVSADCSSCVNGEMKLSGRKGINGLAAAIAKIFFYYCFELFQRTAKLVAVAVHFKPFLEILLRLALYSSLRLELDSKAEIPLARDEKECVRSARNQSESLSCGTVYNTAAVAFVGDMYVASPRFRISVPKPSHTGCLYFSFGLGVLTLLAKRVLLCRYDCHTTKLAFSARLRKKRRSLILLLFHLHLAQDFTLKEKPELRTYVLAVLRP